MSTGKETSLPAETPSPNESGPFEPAPAGPKQPLQLLDVTVSPSCDRLYLVDSKGGRVLITTPEGKLIHTIAKW